MPVTLLTVITYSPVGRLGLCRFTPTLFEGSVNCKSRVVDDEVPNPRYNECICYISPFLCLRRQKLQQAVDAGRIEYHSASSAVPPMAWVVVGQVYPSRPVVRPDSSSSSICRIRRNTPSDGLVGASLLVVALGYGRRAFSTERHR